MLVCFFLFLQKTAFNSKRNPGVYSNAIIPCGVERPSSHLYGKFRGCQVHQCLKSQKKKKKEATKATSYELSRKCVYVHALKPPSPHLLAAFLSQVKPARPSTERFHGLAVVPHAQGCFTTHIPFPWLSSSAIAPDPFPNTAETWAARHPTTTAPHFHMAKVPSRPSLLAPDVSH